MTFPGPITVEVDVAAPNGRDYVTAASFANVTSASRVHAILLQARDEGDAVEPVAWLYAEGRRFVGKAELIGDELRLEDWT